MPKDEKQQMIFSNNLNRLVRDSGKTQKEIADRIGVSPQTFNTWCQGIAIPRMGKIQALADFFGVGKTDLLDEKNEEVSYRAVRVPVYGRIPAGIPLEAVQDIIDWEEISPDMIADGSEYIALKVTGTSMYPKYLDGDVVIVKIQPDCESGQDAVVYVNGYEATLKKVLKKEGCIILQPLNSEYEPGIYDYNDEQNPVRILGVVKEIRRKV